MIDPKALRSAFGRFLTGVTVVTAQDADGQPVGFTANSFTSVSLDPPLLLVCPGRHLSRFDCFQNATQFGVSILAEGQQEISNLFAFGKGDRFASCAWDTPVGQTPLIGGRAAGFVCDVSQKVPAGDHIVMIGEVIHFDDAGHAGLGYGPDGYFSRLEDRAAARAAAVRSHVSVLIEERDTVYLSPDAQLPTVNVPAGSSPIEAMRAFLRETEIDARIGAVYAVWDEDDGSRHLVLRAKLAGNLGALRPHSIADLAKLDVPDPATASLLSRFALEHRQQAFGFYVGSAVSGDVLPMNEEN